MKKIIYSNYTKFIAAVLFIISITLGALTITNGVADYCSEKELIYGFESDFNEARHFSSLLDAPEFAIFNAYHNFYLVDDENETVDRERPLIINGETIEQSIEQRLNDLYCADKINYFVKWNDTVFTNCGAANEQELMTAQFYRLTKRDNKGNTEIESSQSRYYSHPLLDELSLYDKTTSIVVCTSIKQAYVDECAEVWLRQSAIVNEAITSGAFYVVLALLLFIYLLCVCGKTKDGQHKSMWLDNIWTEVHLALIAGIGLGAVMICAILLDEYFTGHFPYNLMNMVVGFSAAIASTVVLTSLLSVVRNIKCRKFVESSIIIRVIRWCWRIFVKILKWLRNSFVGYRNIIFKTLHKKTGALLIGTLFGYTALIGLFGIFAFGFGSFFWIFAGIALFGFASFLAAHRSKDVDEIKKGVSEIRNYNSGYKIPELKCEDLRELAENINDIGESIDESVAAKMKAERMKTELITNVSHDLKTPLTSIINYTELLSKVENLPEEAQDYVKVIAKKSDRLKTLTQDLFDISKAQSGNEEIVFEKLDAELLINQTLAEYDSEIQKSELVFCVNTSRELHFPADGRKMSRVIGNLINNILKYSLKNTRVFISAEEKDGEIVFEFKNMSAYPLDFDAEEIMSRFVRGDEARTTEGSGLGLAIAKTYTELCNGKMEIILDGDMFKAILKFKKY